MRHIPFFFDCLYFFIDIEHAINCQEVNIVFSCSRIRSRDFDKTHNFLDIVIDECDFQEDFCDMVTPTIDFLIFVLKGQFTYLIII